MPPYRCVDEFALSAVAHPLSSEWIDYYVEIKCQLDATEVFIAESYCLFNMFRAPLCPSSGAQEYYTVVAACGISCCGFQVASLVWS